MKFKVLFPDGKAINQNTIINGNKITNESDIAKFIKAIWCRWSNSKNFTAWSNELNESGEYEGKFTPYDAIDNLASNYHLEINGRAINLYDFILKYDPDKGK
jgi:hypothetical protein